MSNLFLGPASFPNKDVRWVGEGNDCVIFWVKGCMSYGGTKRGGSQGVGLL